MQQQSVKSKRRMKESVCTLIKLAVELSMRLYQLGFI